MTAFEQAHDTAPTRGAHGLIARILAELAGSFLICFAIYVMCTLGTSVYNPNLAFLAIGTALAYGAVTYLMGPISGGQFNPAVTLASMLVSRTRVIDGLCYIVAQLVGGIVAGALVRFLLPTSDVISLTVWLTPVVNGFDEGSVSYSYLTNANLSFGIMLAIAVEIVASLLIVGVAMRNSDAQEKPASTRALAMGAAYGVGAMIAYPITGAALNPVRATGIAIFAQGQGLTAEPLGQLWVFWVCPILAAAIVALVMIVAQMSRVAGARRAAAVPAVPAGVQGAAEAAEADAGTDGAEPQAQTEATAADAPADGVDAPAATPSDEQPDAEVRQEQADPQGDADEGVERH